MTLRASANGRIPLTPQTAMTTKAHEHPVKLSRGYRSNVLPLSKTRIICSIRNITFPRWTLRNPFEELFSKNFCFLGIKFRSTTIWQFGWCLKNWLFLEQHPNTKLGDGKEASCVLMANGILTMVPSISDTWQDICDAFNPATIHTFYHMFKPLEGRKHIKNWPPPPQKMCQGYDNS